MDQERLLNEVKQALARDDVSWPLFFFDVERADILVCLAPWPKRVLSLTPHTSCFFFFFFPIGPGCDCYTAIQVWRSKL